MLMKRLILIFVIFSLLLSACDPTTKNTETPTPQVTATLPSPSVSREELPDAEALAANYFQNWKIEDYNRMYEFLTIPAKLLTVLRTSLHATRKQLLT